MMTPMRGRRSPPRLDVVSRRGDKVSAGDLDLPRALPRVGTAPQKNKRRPRRAARPRRKAVTATGPRLWRRTRKAMSPLHSWSQRRARMMMMMIHRHSWRTKTAAAAAAGRQVRRTSPSLRVSGADAWAWPHGMGIRVRQRGRGTCAAVRLLNVCMGIPVHGDVCASECMSAWQTRRVPMCPGTDIGFLRFR